jgi:hypothetical protein
MSHSVAWYLGFNINSPCVVANVGVTDIMLCNMALASTPLAVGRVARSVIEKGLLLERFVWGVIAREGSPRHWMQCRNVKKKTVLRTYL